MGWVKPKMSYQVIQGLDSLALTYSLSFSWILWFSVPPSLAVRSCSLASARVWMPMLLWSFFLPTFIWPALSFPLQPFSLEKPLDGRSCVLCTFSSLMLRGFLLLIGLWVLSRLFSLYLCSFYFQVLTSQKNLSCFLRAFLECMPMAFGISDSPFPPQPAPPLVVIRQELSGLIPLASSLLDCLPKARSPGCLFTSAFL